MGSKKDLFFFVNKNPKIIQVVLRSILCVFELHEKTDEKVCKLLIDQSWIWYKFYDNHIYPHMFNALFLLSMLQIFFWHFCFCTYLCYRINWQINCNLRIKKKVKKSSFIAPSQLQLWEWEMLTIVFFHLFDKKGVFWEKQTRLFKFMCWEHSHNIH